MLQSQSILITGCSTGIGRALALELAARGHTVFATARRVETLADIASDRLVPLALDVLDESSVERVVEEVLGRAGRVDILINNAGVSATGPLVETPFSRLKSLVDTNLTAPMKMVQSVFPSMADRGAGRIVNIGSVVGVFPSPFTAAYCATKAGLHMLSQVLRLELAPFGIDVIVVQPAAVKSEIEARSAEGMEAFARTDSRYRPLVQAIRKRSEQPQKDPVSTEEFARKTADAILADRAPRVVYGGRGSTFLQLAARLPAPVREALTRRDFGLTERVGPSPKP